MVATPDVRSIPPLFPSERWILNWSLSSRGWEQLRRSTESISDKSVCNHRLHARSSIESLCTGWLCEREGFGITATSCSLLNFTLKNPLNHCAIICPCACKQNRVTQWIKQAQHWSWMRHLVWILREHYQMARNFIRRFWKKGSRN